MLATLTDKLIEEAVVAIAVPIEEDSIAAALRAGETAVASVRAFIANF